MLKSVDIKDLTVFPHASLQFSPQLNVISGENGSGKSHLLKVAYSVLAVSFEEGRKQNDLSPTKAQLQTKLADKLVGVFRAEAVGRLARRKHGRSRSEIQFCFDNHKLDISFNVASMRKSEVGIDKLPKTWLETPPVFLPTRELLTIYPGFVSVYENHYLEFEETWRDTCSLLGALPLRGPRVQSVEKLLSPLEEAMKGNIELDMNGHFYLRTSGKPGAPGEGRMEITLVAEGLRKLAMLARLIATGSLRDKGYLFWDEPEANLNPKLIKQVAKVILQLCQNGIQVFIATHSLFLMREIDILLQKNFNDVKARFFGLQLGEDGVSVKQGESVDDIGSITSLEEELSQSDTYLATE
ncbi:MAG: AAA family ATPase [Nitrospinae bacterium]|nr:AAA family ATPase [Nitrospinota bacterium]